MQTYNGFYVGVVIQNNDPEKRGRCKVFIPHINTNIINQWLDTPIDRSFSFIDIENNKDIQEILPKLKDALPWAEYAGQIFGGNSTGRYNATTKEGYTENHNQWSGDSPAFIHRPSSKFSNVQPPTDNFTDPRKLNKVNPYAHAYSSSDYSTLASGVFSIPNVGAHVWCFFNNGNPNIPVYFASSYSTEDIKRIYTKTKHSLDTYEEVDQEITDSLEVSVDYPATYENIEKEDFDSDAQTFRSKHVINTNKNTFEMVDTDNNESIKLTHYSGSFKEFTNFSNIELATKNDQKLVLGDQFETVQSTKNLQVGSDYNKYIWGDEYETIGENDPNITLQIKKYLTDIHEYVQLFDVRRARIYNGTDTVQAGGEIKPADSLPNFLSPKQIKQKSNNPLKNNTDEKGHTICPICNAQPYSFDSEQYLMGISNVVLITSISKLAGPLINVSSPYSVLQVVANQPSLRLTLPLPSEADITFSRSLQSLSGKRGYFAGAKCDVCNSDLLFIPDKNEGYSPSSVNGEFEPEFDKTSEGALGKLLEQTTPKLLELERKLSGGDKIVNITRDKVETIGTVMNDLPSIRVDPVGKLRSESVFVSPESVYISYRPSPHIEAVDVMDVPGGDYNLTVMNKFKLLVGAKGVNIKTFGPIEMYGTLVNLNGQQINMSSQYETNIDGGDRFSLRARKISLHPKEHSPVIVDGAFHVSRNAVIRGGAYVDGQFATPAIASLREYGETSDGLWSPPSSDGTANPEGVGWAYVASGMTGPLPNMPMGVPVNVLIPPHTHLYERPPTQLFNSIQALRAFMAEPNNVPTRFSSSSSINDVRVSSAATPINDSAMGEDKLPVIQYAEIIKTKIQQNLRSDPSIRLIGSINVQSVNKDSTGTIYSGILTVDIKRTHDGTAKSNKIHTYTYGINYSIKVQENNYVSEDKKPTYRVIASRGHNGGPAASNPPEIL